MEKCLCLISPELKLLKVFFSHHPSVSMLCSVSRFSFHKWNKFLMTAAITEAIFIPTPTSLLQSLSSYASVCLAVSLQQITQLGSSGGSQNLLCDGESMELLPLHHNR